MGKYFEKQATAGVIKAVAGGIAVGAAVGIPTALGLRALGNRQMSKAPTDSIEGGIYSLNQGLKNPATTRKDHIAAGNALIKGVTSGTMKPVYGKLEHYQKSLAKDAKKVTGGWDKAFGTDYDNYRTKKKLPII